MESSQDIALRAHIQDQLLDYVNEHINIDHVAYTEYVATKVCCREIDSEVCAHRFHQFLSENLKPVSLFDATNIALPEDPLALLLRQHGLQGQVNYIPSERLPITLETKHYLFDSRKKFTSKVEPPSMRYMRSDGPGK